MTEDHGESPPAVVLDDAIFVVGGYKSTGLEQIVYTPTIERFDQSSKVWTFVGNMGSSVSEYALAASNRSIYCIGGRDGTYQALNTVMRFSPDEGTWSYVSPMNQRRFGAAAQELNEKIYVMGGVLNCNSDPTVWSLLSFVEYYEPKKNTWTVVNQMLSTRAYFNACIVNRQIFAVGDKKRVKTSEKMNSAGEWEKVEIGRDPALICGVYRYLELVPPVKLMNVIAKKKHVGFLVSWQKLEYTNGLKYCVQLFCNGDAEGEIKTLSVPEYYLDSPKRSVKYFFRVWARNCDGEGEKSDSNNIISYRNISTNDGIYYDKNFMLRQGYKVYLGETDETYPEDVAVKLFDLRNNSKREIDNMIELVRHDNVVLYKKFGYIPGPKGKLCYLAMELCEKNTLQEIIANNNLSYEYRKVILLQIGHGLLHVHTRKILHRDLKPQNILRSKDGCNMKLADFGFSKKCTEDKSMVSKSAMDIGTEGWGSPEHYGTKNMTKRSDTYSFGLIIYFVLTNGNHVYGPRTSSWKPSIIEGKEVNLQNLNCPDAGIARDLITKMLDPSPGKRLSAEEVLKHPFFWDDEKKMQFLCKVRILFVQGVISKLGEEEVDWLNRLVLNQAEKDKISSLNGREPVVLLAQNMYESNPNNKRMRYEDNSISGLLKFIQFLSQEYNMDGVNMKALFKEPSHIWQFISSRFPTLLPKVFNEVKDVAELQEFFVISPHKPLKTSENDA